MDQAERELQPGEPVAWNYGAGQAHGHVVGKITEDKKIGARTFKASSDDPKYVVKSDSSGKEAVKKPEVLHKLDEDANEGDADASSDSEDVENETGAKEKRDGRNARSSNEERKEAEHEENSKKVQDTGKGPVRASAKAAQTKIRNAAKDIGTQESVGDEDAPYKPEKSELQLQDEEEVVETLTPEENAPEALKETGREDGKVVDEANFIVDDGEPQDEDETYDPVIDEDSNAVPSDEAPVMHAGKGQRKKLNS